jgi:hypothetical protein
MITAMAHAIITTAVLAQAAIALAVMLRAWGQNPEKKISQQSYKML